MTKRVPAVLLAFLIVLAAAAGAHAQTEAQPLVGYVTRVIDGDTIVAMVGSHLETIRYIGMNAPELHHPTLGEQPGGRAAMEVNRQLVGGQWVQLVLDRDQRDVHGRLL